MIETGGDLAHARADAERGYSSAAVTLELLDEVARLRGATPRLREILAKIRKARQDFRDKLITFSLWRAETDAAFREALELLEEKS